MVKGAGESGPHPVDRHVGRKVCEKRIALGYNQSDLGRALGLTFQQIQKYETGMNRVSASRLFDIAREMDVPVSFFFEGLDSGSTATAVARCVPDEPMLIFTSGLTCAIELARLEKPKVSIPGGTLNRFSHSVCGVRGIQELEGVHFDLLLLVVTSYSPETGFACGVEEEALLKQTVLHRAEHVAVLLDSSKIERRSTFRICGLDEVDTVISDGRLPPEFLSACENAGVKVL